MKATALYVAKRELIDRIDRASKEVGGVLDGVQVSYMRPGNVADRAIYGGSGRSTRGAADAESRTAEEALTMGLYVRTLGFTDSVRDAEAEVETLADAAVTLLYEDPELSGELSFGEVLATIADVYSHHEQIECILGLSIRLDTVLLP